MTRVNAFLEVLASLDIDMFTGVPDSLMKGFISALPDAGSGAHVIAANEGAAVAYGAGYHLATGKIPVVYLQNSGLGNIINPVTSMADPAVYGIPMILMIGWRGQPGLKDEPQHIKMGAITLSLLQALDIPYCTVNEKKDWHAAVKEIAARALVERRPVAIVVEEGFFEGQEMIPPSDHQLNSEDAIGIICASLTPEDILICTTGKIGRVFYKLNKETNRIKNYFLNVGSMGHALSIGTAVARYQNKRVVVLDGDGALLMHMGSLALPPSMQLSNFKYVLLNNGTHQSVGGQPTLGFEVDFTAIAKGCGFEKAVCVSDRQGLENEAANFDAVQFLEVRINSQTIEPLPRPAETPAAAKESFMNKLQGRY